MAAHISNCLKLVTFKPNLWHVVNYVISKQGVWNPPIWKLFDGNAWLKYCLFLITYISTNDNTNCSEFRNLINCFRMSGYFSIISNIFDDQVTSLLSTSFLLHYKQKLFLDVSHFWQHQCCPRNGFFTLPPRKGDSVLYCRDKLCTAKQTKQKQRWRKLS